MVYKNLNNEIAIGISLQIAGTTEVTAIIDDNTMATAAGTNIPTAESVKEYIAAITVDGGTL